MKNALTACIALALFTACEKKQPVNDYVPNPNNEAVGEWKHTEKYVSPGSAWHWENVANGLVLTIHADSTYELTNGTGLEFWPFSSIAPQGKFGVTSKNNWKLTYFIKQPSNDSIFSYPIRVSKDTLELSGLCIEGCTYRFRKIK